MFHAARRVEERGKVVTISRNRARDALLSAADIFVPELRILRDEGAHHFDAFGQIEVGNFNTVVAQEVDGTGKCAALTNDAVS